MYIHRTSFTILSPGYTVPWSHPAVPLSSPFNGLDWDFKDHLDPCPAMVAGLFKAPSSLAPSFEGALCLHTQGIHSRFESRAVNDPDGRSWVRFSICEHFVQKYFFNGTWVKILILINDSSSA